MCSSICAKAPIYQIQFHKESIRNGIGIHRPVTLQAET